MEPSADQTYSSKVMITDNFHHMNPDESEAYQFGVFDSCEAARTACTEIVDENLLSAYKPDEGEGNSTS